MKNKVEQLRKERGLNQDDFAKMLRVSRQTISSIVLNVKLNGNNLINLNDDIFENKKAIVKLYGDQSQII